MRGCSNKTSNNLKEILPSTLRMHSFIVKKDTFEGCANLLDQTAFQNAKKKLKQGLNIKTIDTELRKIYFFIGEEELKYYNFYAHVKHLITLIFFIK